MDLHSISWRQLPTSFDAHNCIATESAMSAWNLCHHNGISTKSLEQCLLKMPIELCASAGQSCLLKPVLSVRGDGNSWRQSGVHKCGSDAAGCQRQSGAVQAVLLQPPHGGANDRWSRQCSLWQVQKQQLLAVKSCISWKLWNTFELSTCDTPHAIFNTQYVRVYIYEVQMMKCPWHLHQCLYNTHT